MRHRSLFSACLTGMLLATITVNAEGSEPASDCEGAFPTPLSAGLKTIMDVVLDNHVEPPARQQMFLGGIAAPSCKKHKPPAPRISRHAYPD